MGIIHKLKFERANVVAAPKRHCELKSTVSSSVAHAITEVIIISVLTIVALFESTRVGICANHRFLGVHTMIFARFYS